MFKSMSPVTPLIHKSLRNDEKTNTIYSTQDYGKFSSIGGNRHVLKSHVNTIVDAIKTNNLLSSSPILVNEKMQVIDGQHRLAAAKELGVPVFYIIHPGLVLKDVQAINSNKKNWKVEDYAQSYASIGNPHYIEYIRFRDKYKIGHKESVLLLTCKHGANNYKAGGTMDFKNGKFIVPNISLAHERARKLFGYEKYYQGFRRRCFIYAVFKLLNNKEYDHDIMMKKLQYQSTRLVDCVSVDDYLLLLENIYNYKNRKNVRFI